MCVFVIDLIFRAILGSQQKLSRGYRDVPNTPCPHHTSELVSMGDGTKAERRAAGPKVERESL